jgi:hypothetical protein
VTNLQRAAALALVSTFATGCVTKPTMKLNHAEISGIVLGNPPAVQMTIVMDVYNPNSYDVAVRAVRGQAIMASKYPIDVDFKAPEGGIWMNADNTTQLRVPVMIPMALGFQLLQEAANSPAILYRFVGKADVTGTRTFAIEKDDYAVDEPGQITREQIAAILPNSLAPH